MAKSDRTGDTQYAALPYRHGRHGMQIMLLTSRNTGRWVIPKGWPMFARKPHQVAAIEALQEGGIKGVVERKPAGIYHYNKGLPNGEDRLCGVLVFPFRVVLEANTWREKAERKRVWFSKDEAASLVDEGGLALIIDEAVRPCRAVRSQV